jgi:hypothetical protein
VTIALWLAENSKQDITSWYDEKQWHDMLKSSFSAMLLSIPGMAVLLFLDTPLYIFWLPCCLCLVLTLFSSGNIYYYRKT